MKKAKGIGSTLESLLQEEGILEEVRIKALKTAISLQIQATMKKKKLSQAEVAKRMHTSRAVLQRLLDPNTISVTLSTLDRVAHALGKTLHISIK
ncbi:MAG: XRE family transcriptional regulator [bacterium]|nr:XRE family transcriptional regulator [bacterium]